jgi:hypothetical protein
LVGQGCKIERLTPKTARHIFATIFGRNAKTMDDAFKLQKILGHKFFETKEVYITSNKPTAADITEKFEALKTIEESEALSGQSERRKIP